jgi:hypothetical protein
VLPHFGLRIMTKLLSPKIRGLLRDWVVERGLRRQESGPCTAERFVITG